MDYEGRGMDVGDVVHFAVFCARHVGGSSWWEAAEGVEGSRGRVLRLVGGEVGANGVGVGMGWGWGGGGW